jgi:hypothetical protein
MLTLYLKHFIILGYWVLEILKLANADAYVSLNIVLVIGIA